MTCKYLLAVLILIVLTACSSGQTAINQDPTTPTLTDQSNTPQHAESSINLWGYWDVSMDPDTGEIEITPARSTEMILNVTSFIDGPPPNLTIDILGSDPQPGYTGLTLDVGLEHPFPGAPETSAFDVMGIFMGNGTSMFQDTDLSIPGAADQRLLNSDGFTRWFNADEFSTAGQQSPLQGYVPSILGTSGYTPTANLNPYKYFADGLGADTDPFTHLSSYMYSRGIFRAGSTNHRNFELRFPTSTGIKFQFAVTANWAQSLTYPDPPLTPADWPVDANALEAVALDVDNYSSIYHLEDGTSGGSINLEFSLLDWDAPLNGDGEVEQYNINVYSELWDGCMEPDMTPVYSCDNFHTFSFQYDVGELTSNDPIPLWVEVVYEDYDYSSPLGVENDADGNLTSYFVTEIPVPDFISTSDILITVNTPSDGDILYEGTSFNITWETVNLYSDVDLAYSTDDFAADINLIAEGIEDSGSFLWEDIPEVSSNTVKIRINSTEDPEIFGASNGYFSMVKSCGTWYTAETFIPDPQPNQIGVPVDLAIYSDGENQSRCQLLDAANENTFMIFDDTYSNILQSWKYIEAQNMKNNGVHVDTIHNFDTFTDGTWLFMTNNDDHPAVPAYVQDPMHGCISGNNNVTGDFATDGFGIPNFLFHGDGGSSSTPDPEAWPWRYISDVSSGVIGGIGGDFSDSRAYYIFPMSPLEDEPTGWIGLGVAQLIDGVYNTGYWTASTGQDWVGSGLVDDSNARVMALAADDDTGMTISESDQVVAYWILDTSGVGQAHLVSMELSADYLVLPEDQLDSEEYGTAIPVDVEMVPSRAHGYDVCGFNWLTALLDNGDGTWSVGVWEFNYEYAGTSDSPGIFHLIDITDPVDGIPQAIDVDSTDFEIHVLYLDDGNYTVDVLKYQA